MAKSSRGIRGVVCAAALLATTAVQAAVSGAIFTTLADGSAVNANIFSAKCDGLGVYLDGGPGPNAPQGAAGLPDGDYFYQVTDPSGKTLLSTDAQRYRRFTVTAGIISSRVTPAVAGDHQTGVDVDHGAVTIELCPFLDTPNNGGEYKVWVTPVASFAGNANLVDNGYNPGFFHGFLPAASKTDNFKVKSRRSVCLTIIKFADNGDERYTYGEPLLNWPVHIYDSQGIEVRGTLWTGAPGTMFPTLRVCALPPGDYTVSEEPYNLLIYGSWQVNTNLLDKTYLTPAKHSVVVRMGTVDRTLYFGNLGK